MEYVLGIIDALGTLLWKEAYLKGNCTADSEIHWPIVQEPAHDVSKELHPVKKLCIWVGYSQCKRLLSTLRKNILEYYFMMTPIDGLSD